MKNLNLIAALVALCLLASVSAFLMPVHGATMSYLTIALAFSVGIACLITMLQILKKKD